MLKIINDLRPFFEDCYRRISVREYARLVEVSPPTSSKLLNAHFKEGLLLKEKYRNYLFFHANKGSAEFIGLSRIYWKKALKDLMTLMEKRLSSPTVVLFGSLAKAEAKPDSDIDLAIFAHKREVDVSEFEKKIGRKIEAFWFLSLKDVKSMELANNIVNGHVLMGRLTL